MGAEERETNGTNGTNATSGTPPRIKGIAFQTRRPADPPGKHKGAKTQRHKGVCDGDH